DRNDGRNKQQQLVEATAIHHIYTSGHLGDLLEAGGFTGVERYADPDGTPYSLGAGRLLLVACRAG
nr:hypothetical protein [Micromonospora sp. DSM 115978]